MNSAISFLLKLETPCPVCGWWNETNDECVYHPNGEEVTA